MDKNKQNIRIRAIKAKYYSKIRSLFDKSLGKDGDVYNKIEEILVSLIAPLIVTELSSFN